MEPETGVIPSCFSQRFLFLGVLIREYALCEKATLIPGQ